MKVAIINGSDFGSTGKISLDIMNYVESKDNNKCILFVSNKRTDKSNVDCIDRNKILKMINRFTVKIFGSDCFRSFINTKRLIKKLKRGKFDLIHIHTLHGYYINLSMLSKFIQRHKIPVIWTLHDNWIFTGRCASIPEKCKMIYKECEKCDFKNEYPRTIFDRAHHFFLKKQKIIQSFDKIVFVSPSKWNLNCGSENTLKYKQKIVINNGIDLSVFHPTTSNLRETYNINDKFVILCVAYPWSEAKGITYINRLAEELDPSKYAILMIGVEENIITHHNIIRINPIYNQNELAKYYSIADVFLSPTLADNYPTVAMEAISCGCPVVIFDIGGTSEIVSKDVGILVSKGDYEGLKNAVINVYNQPFDRKKCAGKAKIFSKEYMLSQYYELYKLIIKKDR